MIRSKHYERSSDLDKITQFVLKESDTLALGLIIFLYIVGIGLLTQNPQLITSLTALMLVLQVGLLLFVMRRNTRLLLWLLATIGTAGFLVEAIGVNTGILFGEYQYGSALGPKLFGTPLLIGVNWFFVTVCVVSMVRAIKESPKYSAVVSASVFVAYDFVLERFATKFDLWQWDGGGIPLKNYITWWILGYIFSAIIIKKVAHARYVFIYKYTRLLLVLHIVFFVITMGIQ